jgi:DNA-binding response OmpR family regulator
MTAERPLEGQRVLVVEDQYLVADEMRRAIQNLGGMVVGPAPRAQIGLNLLEGEGVDLAVLDINLGREDVYPVARELHRRKVPFLFATGCEPWVIAEDFAAVPRIEKPVTAKVLSEVLRRLME